MTDASPLMDCARTEVALSHDLHAFFDAYRSAFNALDGAAVAALYAVPGGIAQDGRFTLWTDRSQVVDNMQALCALYSERGYMQAVFQCRSFLDQGPQHAVVDLQWRIDWRAQTPWHFSTAYNLMRTAEGWRVLLCTAYTEVALHRE
jgi:hypothetical protein